MPRIAHTVLDSETGYACVIRAGHHELTADEPGSRGGTDTGPAPYELLLASLAACTAITLRMGAPRKGWELGSIHVDLELHKAAEGGRDRITRVISLTGPLHARQKAALADAAEKTPSTRAMMSGAPVRPKFSYPRSWLSRPSRDTLS